MKSAEQLLEKYNAGLASAEEAAIVERWYLTADITHALPDIQQIVDDQLDSRKKLSRYMRSKQKFRLWPAVSSAAAIVIIAGAGWLYFSKPKAVPQLTSKAQADVAPGGNKAVLTLADGKKIALTNVDNGTLAEQAGIDVVKTKDGQLIYQVATNKQSPSAARENTYNSIATPRGGQYQIVLPDGTKIWLNALSSITYPVSIGTDKQRKVILRGEGYFEVAPDAGRPFLVTTNKQNVVVLGTHFNVNNYDDEQVTSTTLLEGRVKVYNDKYSRIINPGQQAQFEPTGRINVSPVNTEQVVAWKNGVFSFKKAGLQTVMRQIARWYDVEITYEGKAPEISFTGKIYRNVTLQEALKSIGYIGVQYSIKNRNVSIKAE